MSTVIKVENISKQYRLGQVGTGSLAHDVNRGWQRLRGKEDPYLKIGEANDRTVKGESNYVWAVKDINFDVQQGEVLGIIGRNGAGKSTLLKILSRTTTPTTGSIKIKGRIASLLEVGTGFHPELSGRENIFLNGAIMGMTRAEIKKKFDEIVDFAGVERYIDTPVKRYSSGMYVRLAFGVAAHLEPDILIVDEVLAVGDAEFQKKALGKMKEVSGKDGRTVLFVSHNIAAIKNLCDRGILLKNGNLDFAGKIIDSINKYLISGNDTDPGTDLTAIKSRTGDGSVSFSSFYVENEAGEVVQRIFTGDSIRLCFRLKINKRGVKNIDLGFSLHNIYDDVQAYSYSGFQNVYFCDANNDYIIIKYLLKEFPFTQGSLQVRGRVLCDGVEADWPRDILGIINIEWGDFFGTGKKTDINAPFLIKGKWE